MINIERVVLRDNMFTGLTIAKDQSVTLASFSGWSNRIIEFGYPNDQQGGHISTRVLINKIINAQPAEIKQKFLEIKVSDITSLQDFMKKVKLAITTAGSESMVRSALMNTRQNPKEDTRTFINRVYSLWREAYPTHEERTNAKSTLFSVITGRLRNTKLVEYFFMMTPKTIMPQEYEGLRERMLEVEGQLLTFQTIHEQGQIANFTRSQDTTPQDNRLFEPMDVDSIRRKRRSVQNVNPQRNPRQGTSGRKFQKKTPEQGGSDKWKPKCFRCG